MLRLAPSVVMDRDLEGRPQFQRVIRQNGVDAHGGCLPPIVGDITTDGRPSNEAVFFGSLHSLDLFIRRQEPKVNPIGIGSSQGLGKLVGVVGNGSSMSLQLGSSKVAPNFWR